MDQGLRQQLELTRNSFYKLQQNFNNNLLVIQELEEENQELRRENERIKTEMDVEIQHLINQERELNEKRMEDISIEYELKMRQFKRENDNEIESMVEMMNQKYNEDIKYEKQKWTRQKKELNTRILQYENSVSDYIEENRKLGEALKQLRYEKERISDELHELVVQKQSYSNKFTLHQKELENIRNSNNEWEEILKDKVKEANKEKQKAEEELCELKVNYKAKLGKAKEESMKKMDEMMKEMEKSNKQILQQSKQIKMKYDLIVVEEEKIKLQLENERREKDKLEKQNYEIKKKAASQKEVESLKKMAEQERKYLGNEVQTLKQQRIQLKEEVKESNSKRQDAEKAVQRLKIAFQNSQKELTQMENKIKKVEKEKGREKKQKQKQVVHYKYDRQEEDRVEQTQHYAEYSKYFSEDMGPIQDTFFAEGMKSSLPKSPKMVKGNSGANHQLLKRVGQLQVEIDQYKGVIKTMTQEMSRSKNNWNDQLNLKDQQIKLCRDENLMLRGRINEKDEQLIYMGNVKQEISELKEKNKQYRQELNEERNKACDQSIIVRRVEGEIEELKEKEKQYEKQIKSLKWERDILDNISTELRSELEDLRGDGRNNEDEQSEDSFQEIHELQIPSRGQRKRELEMKKQKSRSKSGKKRNIPEKLNENRSSIKLKDMIKRKKELQMEGKKAMISMKQIGRVENRGTQSQKEIYQQLKRKSKEKKKKVVNYAQMAHHPHNQGQDDFHD